MTATSSATPGDREWLTVTEILTMLGEPGGRPLPRRTWQQWRSDGNAPECHRLPNGQLRIHRPAFDAWMARHKEHKEHQ